MTTTYTNDGSLVVLSDASVNLTVPSGWTAEATSPTTFTPGQSVNTTWTVDAVCRAWSRWDTQRFTVCSSTSPSVPKRNNPSPWETRWTACPTGTRWR
ncbi:NEW3 domain-containing protein [Streptomyces sp. NPDC002596]